MLHSHSGDIPIEDVPPAAKKAKAFQGHSYKPLLSLGQFADSGYTFSGCAEKISLQHPSCQPLYPHQCPTSGMYLMSLVHPTAAHACALDMTPNTTQSPEPQPQSQPWPPRTYVAAASGPNLSSTTKTPTKTPPHTQNPVSNTAYEMKTKRDLEIFYHRALFSPTQATLTKAINNGHLATWPGLTASLISKHLPKSINTDLGHAKLQRQHVRSTQQSAVPAPPAPTPAPKQKMLFTKVLEERSLLASDLTGRFPVMSSRGHNYIFVAYHYDANYIAVRPLKSRSASELCTVYL